MVRHTGVLGCTSHAKQALRSPNLVLTSCLYYLQAERRAKALDLLQAGWPLHLQDNPKYEPAHALLLCRLHGFQPGLLFLYDRMRLYREVLQVWKV